MIIISLLWLYKRFILPRIRIRPIDGNIIIKCFNRVLIFFLLLQGLPLHSFEKEELYTYTISRNGKSIGRMQLSRKINGSDLYLTIKSEVKTRFVVAINVNTLDEAHFNNGTLLYSSVTRTINGKEKEHKKTQLIGKRYEIQSGSAGVKQFNETISYNMMLLYLKEPGDINAVYSDNFQQFIKVNKIGTHLYRLYLTDGNYNDYYFQDGICSEVSIYRSLYTIKMTLVK